MKSSAVIIFILVLGCQVKNEQVNVVGKNISAIMGNKINFVDLTLYCGESINNCTDLLSNLKDGYKVVTLINVDCNDCITKIRSWNEWDMKFNKSRGIVMIPYSIDSLQSFEFMVDNGKFKTQPFYLDRKAQFVLKNNLPKDDRYHTLLLDDQNKVILVGSPLKNLKLSDLYVDQLNNEL